MSLNHTQILIHIFPIINRIKNRLTLNKKYIFKSERLGFRDWLKSDLKELEMMNSDVEVMEHFPKTLTKKENEQFFKKLSCHYKNHGYTYFATETLENNQFIGFIGLAYQDYQTAFTPAVDIGWRLRKSAWGKGYATEGAKRCLAFGFSELNFNKIIATCTVDNLRSENVMRKIGMEQLGIFKHPRLEEYPKYEECKCYGINKHEWQHRLSNNIE